jgi:hypothetical protein
MAVNTSDYLVNRSPVDNRYVLTKIYVDDYVFPGRRRYGLWKYPDFQSRPEIPLKEGTYYRYTVTAVDIGRIDLIAWKYYRNVNWWWVIAMVNHIANPLTDLVIGQVLLIPKKDIVTTAIEKALA